MSFQRRVILPPLALAVHPAPPPKKVEKKDKDDKEKEKAKKEVMKDDKQPEEKVDAKDNLVDLRSDKKEPAKAKAIGGGDQASPTNVPPRQLQVTGDRVAEGVTPDSPASMVPEPGTPGSAGPQPGTPALAAPGATDDVPRVPPPQPDPKSPKGDSKPTTGDNKDDKESKDKEDEPEVPPPPLRLLGPVPHRPIRTKLDLNPAIPYPPINTDPRGAYYKYAKFNQGEWMMIDVTKDGWLSEQWREKGEREALARLRGESEVVAKREAEKIKRMESIRKVPDTADGILLELWNDLVEALNHECTVADFWSRYDWTTPEAQKHLKPARRAPRKVESDKTQDKDEKKGEGEKNEKKEDKSEEPVVFNDGLDEVEWTKEGLEKILGTVGVQCSYNTAKPLPRHWAEPAGAYLILGHGYFMLRTEDILQWKPEENADKFEMLVTSGHDRVFGEMVKAQQAEERKKKEKEYRERKLAERKKAEEEHKRKKKEAEGKEDQKEKKDEAEAKKDEDETLVPPTPATGDSNIKVKDGEEVAPPKDIQAVAVKGDKVVVAVPVKDDKLGDKSPETKHEVEPIAAAPGEATKPEAAEAAKAEVVEEVEVKEGKVVNKQEAGVKDKDAKAKEHKEGKEAKLKKPFDPVREAELLAKMVASGQTPPGVGMEDIKLAFKALEAATGAMGGKDKKDVPVIWTWHDRCEGWRWKNYEAGVHDVRPGGWEERDWKVFADDRGCEDFELEESWAEEEEVDVHDWSL